jgi:hypothetical protein
VREVEKAREALGLQISEINLSGYQARNVIPFAAICVLYPLRFFADCFFLMVASIFSMPATRAGVAEVTRQAEVPLSDARLTAGHCTSPVAGG